MEKEEIHKSEKSDLEKPEVQKNDKEGKNKQRQGV